MVRPIDNFIANHFEKPLQAASKSFKFFEDKIWKGINESKKIAKSSMKIAVAKTPSLSPKLGRAIAGVGLLSGISFLLNLKSIPGHIQTFIKNITLHDAEGTVISLASLISDPFKAMDSLTTFISSLSSLEAIPVIAFFSLIALPLSIGIMSYVVINNTYTIIRNAIFLAQMPKTTDELKTMLDDKLGTRDIQVVKDKKINALKRHTDQKVVNIMKNMQKHFEAHPNDDATAQKAMKDMRTLMVRKITANSIGTAATLAMLVTLVVSTVFGVAPLVIPIVGATKATVMLSKHLYNTLLFGRGLLLPEFAK